MPAFSDEEQQYDQTVNMQPLAIVWQPFLACTLSFPVNTWPLGSAGQISITSAASLSSYTLETADCLKTAGC